MSYIDSNNITGLYPAEYKANGTFCVKSSNIKVFPSSWRGAKLHRTTIDGKTEILPEASVTQFNPESALNTEYNITLPAGGIKTYIDQAYSEQHNDITLYNFKFFINGYAFEVYNLDLRCYKNGEYTVPENLYANIRVGDMAVGSADIDFTKVLMPYNWTAIDTPIPLDASLEDAYLIDQVDTTSWDELELPNGGVNWDAIDNDNDSLKDTYIFTGLVFSTSKLASTNSDTNSTYYSIQLVKNAKICLDKYWPKALSAGDTQTALATKIGQDLIADTDYMLATGRFNSLISSETEVPLLVVGNGTSDELRRNAFEVSGSTSPDEVAIKQDGSEIAVFTQQIKAGPFEVKYNSDLEAKDKAVQVQGVYTINDNVEIAKDGSHIIINKPNEEGVVKSNADIGLKTYGNVKLVGDGTAIHFIDWGTFNKETQQFEEDDSSRIVSSIFVTTGTSTDGNSIKSEAARGLHISNLYEVNQEALLFNPNNLASNKGKLRAINKNILIDRLHDHSIEVGQNGVCIYKDNNTKGIANLTKLNQISVTNDGKFTGSDGKGSSIDLSAEKDVKINNKSLLNLMYPVGSIYMTMSSQHPSKTFEAIGGGKWKRISKGRMLLGVDPDSEEAEDITAAEKTGGSGSYVHPHDHAVSLTGNGLTTGDSITFTNIPEDYTPTFEDTGDKAEKYNQLNFIIPHNEHTHSISADDKTSEHKHTIPVSLPSDLLGMHDRANGGYFSPLNFGGYPTANVLSTKGNMEAFRGQATDEWNNLQNSLDSYKRIVRSGFGEGYRDPDKSWAHYIYNKDGFDTDWGYNENNWWVWQKKENEDYSTSNPNECAHSNIFTDKGQLMIPAVEMGTWFTPTGNSTTRYTIAQWNKEGPVYTGYQYVPDFSTPKGAAINSDFNFESWRLLYDTAWTDFWNLKVKIDLIIEEVKVEGQDDPSYVVRSATNFRVASDTTISTNTKISGSMTYSDNLFEWKDCDYDEADFGNDKYMNDYYQINQTIFNYTKPSFTNSSVNTSSVKTKILEAIEQYAGPTVHTCFSYNNNSFYNVIRKHNLKAYFTRDFFDKTAHNKTITQSTLNANSGWIDYSTATAADIDATHFAFRHDDGAHIHKIEPNSTALLSQAHCLDFGKFKDTVAHTHTISVDNLKVVPLDEDKDATKIKPMRAPYLTCHIWQRMDDWYEEDTDTSDDAYNPSEDIGYTSTL
jgi:hypothetical protein